MKKQIRHIPNGSCFDRKIEQEYGGSALQIENFRKGNGSKSSPCGISTQYTNIRVREMNESDSQLLILLFPLPEP